MVPFILTLQTRLDAPRIPGCRETSGVFHMGSAPVKHVSWPEFPVSAQANRTRSTHRMIPAWTSPFPACASPLLKRHCGSSGAELLPSGFPRFLYFPLQGFQTGADGIGIGRLSGIEHCGRERVEAGIDAIAQGVQSGVEAVETTIEAGEPILHRSGQAVHTAIQPVHPSTKFLDILVQGVQPRAQLPDAGGDHAFQELSQAIKVS